jgi:exodeoxyribonuclease VII large subunit
MDIFAEKTILTVSRLTALIRGVLEDNFDQVWVEGEVSNLSLPSSGHIYFTLKDTGAQVRCVMFKSAAKNLKFRLSGGMGLIVRGRISVYDQRGEYQIICEYMEPAGIGALQMAFVQLKERLALEGLFDEAHKRPMPRFPKRVGVVTSPTGAAIHDILNVLKRRFASLEVLLYPVRVQGDGAAREIAAAIADMNRLDEVDVLIVGRGGGSLEDLWAFNEEILARAVRRSRIPIISAVGHETDWTICDFAADLRAPTPSAAAELVTASAEELRGQVESLAHRLQLGIESYLAGRESQLGMLRRALHDPTTLVGHMAQRVDDLAERLALGLENGLIRRKEQFNRLEQSLSFKNPIHLFTESRQGLQRLESDGNRLMQSKLEGFRLAFGDQAARLEVLSPLSTLARGYAIAMRDKDGSVVTDAARLAVGELLRLNFHRGTATCRVENREAGSILV